MVLYVMSWNIHPDKEEEYPKWAQSAIQRYLKIPGVVEFRGYRTVAGRRQVVITFEFVDMNAFAAWQGSQDVQKITAEAFTMTLNLKVELWGPSPIVPKPIRPSE